MEKCHSEEQRDEESHAARGNTRFLTVTEFILSTVEGFWFGMTSLKITRTDYYLAASLVMKCSPDLMRV